MKEKQIYYMAISLVYLFILSIFLGGLIFGYWYGTSQQENALFTQLAIRDYHLDEYMCLDNGRMKINIPENISKNDLYKP